MTPITPPTAQAGDGLVNATALDGVIRLITARINALIAALGVARGEDRQLATASVRWRMVSERMRGAITEMVDLVADIRRQFHPRDGVTSGTGTVQWTITANNPFNRLFLATPTPEIYKTFVVPQLPDNATAPRFYRIHARARVVGQKNMYFPRWVPIRGLMTLNGTTTIVGVGAAFWTDVFNSVTLTPRLVRIGNEVRTIVSLPATTTMIVDTPFTHIGAGFTMETDAINAFQTNPPEDPLTPKFVSVLRGMPAGAEPQHPLVFGVVPDDANDVVPSRSREATQIITESPALRIVVQWTPALDPTRSIVERDMAPMGSDHVIDFIAEAGSVITLRNTGDDGTGVFALTTETWPPDDDPRYPLLFRFPCLPCFQLDILAIEPWQEDDTLLTTEAGFPITGEAPAAALRI